MKNNIIALLIFLCLFGCDLKEHSVSKDQAFGRYKRNYGRTNEYLCLKKDMSYSYWVEEDDDNVVKTISEWEFDEDNGESRIFLRKFDYMVELEKYSITPTSFSAPILFSEAKNAIVIRMDPDDHFRDFTRIDSTSCE
jgi:hypothetical protein